MKIIKQVTLHSISLQTTAITIVKLEGKISPYGTDVSIEIVPGNEEDINQLLKAASERREITITVDI